jgi:hypothetical protein
MLLYESAHHVFETALMHFPVEESVKDDPFVQHGVIHNW